MKRPDPLGWVLVAILVVLWIAVRIARRCAMHDVDLGSLLHGWPARIVLAVLLFVASVAPWLLP